MKQRQRLAPLFQAPKPLLVGQNSDEKPCSSSIPATPIDQQPRDMMCSSCDMSMSTTMPTQQLSKGEQENKIYEQQKNFFSRSRNWQWQRRRGIRRAMYSLPLVFFTISYIQIWEANDFSSIFHRQLKRSCHTPYVLIQDVLNFMPGQRPEDEISKRSDDNYEPSHIQLCQAFISRQMDSKKEDWQDFSVTEDEDVCMDWKSPHSALLSIFASSLIASVGASLGLDLGYKHECHRHLADALSSSYSSVNFDYTPIQTLLPENLISKDDASKFDTKQMIQLCNGCINQFFSNNNDGADSESNHNMAHHCLLFPGGNAAHHLIENNSSLPLAAVLPSVIDRLRHSTEDWVHTTDPIDFESESGAIIYLDENSSFLAYTDYDQVIPASTTSIQIFVTASCVLAQSGGQSNCVEHGRRLKRYFIQTRTFTIGTYVRIDVVASTAAAYARLMYAHILVCPPGTVSCLFPALSKHPGTKAFVADDECRPVTYHWFDHLIEERDRIGLVVDGEMSLPDDQQHFVQIFDKVHVDMPLDIINEGDDKNKNTVSDDGGNIYLTEEEENGLVENFVQQREVQIPGRHVPVTTPIRYFGRESFSLTKNGNSFIMEIPMPWKPPLSLEEKSAQAVSIKETLELAQVKQENEVSLPHKSGK